MVRHFFQRHINPFAAILIVTLVGCGATLLILRTIALLDVLALTY